MDLTAFNRTGIQRQEPGNGLNVGASTGDHALYGPNEAIHNGLAPRRKAPLSCLEHLADARAAATNARTQCLQATKFLDYAAPVHHSEYEADMMDSAYLEIIDGEDSEPEEEEEDEAAKQERAYALVVQNAEKKNSVVTKPKRGAAPMETRTSGSERLPELSARSSSGPIPKLLDLRTPSSTGGGPGPGALGQGYVAAPLSPVIGSADVRLPRHSLPSSSASASFSPFNKSMGSLLNTGGSFTVMKTGGSFTMGAPRASVEDQGPSSHSVPISPIGAQTTTRARRNSIVFGNDGPLSASALEWLAAPGPPTKSGVSESFTQLPAGPISNSFTTPKAGRRSSQDAPNVDPAPHRQHHNRRKSIEILDEAAAAAAMLMMPNPMMSVSHHMGGMGKPPTGCLKGGGQKDSGGETTRTAVAGRRAQMN